MNFTPGPDLFDAAEAKAAFLDDFTHLIAFDPEEADRERKAALRRQRRNAALMQPFTEITRRLETHVRQYSQKVDAHFLMINFLDFVSERMVGSAELMVPKPEIVSSISERIAAMDPDLETSVRENLAERLVDLATNRDNSATRFEVEQYCPEEDGIVTQRFWYMAIEKVAGVTCYRLTEEGMRLTLRILNIDAEIGGISGDLLKRAFDRKNIAQIISNVSSYKRSCERVAVMIRARLRDIQSNLSFEWDHVANPLSEAQEIVTARSREAFEIGRSIRSIIDEGTYQPGQKAALNRAAQSIEELSGTLSRLNAEVMKAPDLFGEAVLRGIGRSSASAIMPDLLSEVLKPMVLLPVSDPDGFLEVVAATFAGPSVETVPLDLGVLLVELANARNALSDEAEQQDAEEDEALAEIDAGLTLEERIKVDGTLRRIVEEQGPVRISAISRQVQDTRSIPQHLKLAVIIAAATASSPHFVVGKPDARFVIDGVISGDDVTISGKEDE